MLEQSPLVAVSIFAISESGPDSDVGFFPVPCGLLPMAYLTLVLVLLLFLIWLIANG